MCLAVKGPGKNLLTVDFEFITNTCSQKSITISLSVLRELVILIENKLGSPVCLSLEARQAIQEITEKAREVANLACIRIGEGSNQKLSATTAPPPTPPPTPTQ